MQEKEKQTTTISDHTFVFMERLQDIILLAYEDELKFYTSYHSNDTNWFIHSVCIPLEWLSFIMIAAYFRVELFMIVPLTIYYLLIVSPIANTISAIQLVIVGIIQVKRSKWLSSC